MSEAAVMALDLVLVTYGCWLVVRASKKPSVSASDLGIFAYKEDRKEAGQ